jgi:5-methylphenazine-1-carboxylate 1-monooxygenase
VRDRFRCGFVDPVTLIEATGTFYEYPCCDRDPLPRWSFGRATLLGDANDQKRATHLEGMP